MTVRGGAFTIGPLSLTMEPGTLCLLTGPNGTGKSTLINMIVEAYLNPQLDITFSDHRDFRDALGFIPDSFPFGLNFSPKEVGTLLSSIYKEWDWDVFYKLLERFEINPKQKFKQTSLGKQQRFLVAVALSHHAKLLIFDEATEGIDPATRYDILSIINEYIYKYEATAILSTHNVKELGNRVDYVIYLENGIPLIADDIETFYDKANHITVSRGYNEKIRSIESFVDVMQKKRSSQ